MFRVRRRSGRGPVLGLAVALAFSAGVVTGVVGVQTGPATTEGVIAEAADEISHKAADRVSRHELQQAAITGMLRTLDDPWSHYYAPRRLAISRQRDAAPAVRVERLSGGVTVLDVDEFTQGVARTVRQVVTAEPPDPEAGMILDLRGNPGGFLGEAVETASVFLDGGTVVSYERRGHERRVLRAVRDGDTVTPLVVLVDGESASAAEIVAGALQDRNRAVVVGSQTLGKGTIQQAYRLGDGSAVKLTVGRYYTPGGRSISERGITPDVYVEPGSTPEVAERRALDVLTGLLAAAPSAVSYGRRSG